METWRKHSCYAMTCKSPQVPRGSLSVTATAWTSATHRYRHDLTCYLSRVFDLVTNCCWSWSWNLMSSWDCEHRHSKASCCLGFQTTSVVSFPVTHYSRQCWRSSCLSGGCGWQTVGDQLQRCLFRVGRGAVHNGVGFVGQRRLELVAFLFY